MTKDGKTAYVTLGHANNIAVVDVATHAVQGYILVGKRAWGVTLSRDDKTLYVTDGLGDDLTVSRYGKPQGDHICSGRSHAVGRCRR